MRLPIAFRYPSATQLLLYAPWRTRDVIAFLPDTEDVWSVHPFSARAAPFQVRVDERSWDAICVWDALGILPLLESGGSVVHGLS